jgi:hypothetical protein
MRPLAPAILLCLLASGCQVSEPPLTPTQWSTIESRQVDGKRDDVLRAASAVLLDKGYFYLASDRDAGLITAEYVDPQVQEVFRRSGGMRGPVLSDTLALWVWAVNDKTCEVRLQTRHMGHRVADEKAVTDFWVGVQRRMLGGEAAPPSGTTGSATALKDSLAAPAGQQGGAP